LSGSDSEGTERQPSHTSRTVEPGIVGAVWRGLFKVIECAIFSSLLDRYRLRPRRGTICAAARPRLRRTWVPHSGWTNGCGDRHVFGGRFSLNTVRRWSGAATRPPSFPRHSTTELCEPTTSKRPCRIGPHSSNRS